MEEKNLQQDHMIIEEFARKLNKIWPLVSGSTLTSKMSFIGPYIHMPEGKIHGWKSNYTDIQREFNKGKAHIDITFKHLNHLQLQDWPLKTAVEIINIRLFLSYFNT